MNRLPTVFRMPRFRPGPAALALTACLLAACSGAPAPRADASRAENARTYLREAAAALVAGDPEAALLSLDDTAAFKDALPADLRGQIDLAYGEANLAFADLRRRQDGNADVGMLLMDAEASLRRAADTLPESPRPLILLATALRRQGKNADAAEVAGRAVDAIEAHTESESPSRELIEPLLLRAQARTQELARARQQEIAEQEEGESNEPSEATMELAQSVLADISRAQSLDPRRPEPYVAASTVHRWIGRFGDAMRSLEDGVRADPANAELHVALQDLYLGAGRQLELAGLYERLAREIRPETADVQWFLGTAHQSLALALRQKGDRRAAERRYDKAAAAFERCAELQPSYAPSCNVRRALCKVAKARMALDEGQEKLAEERLDRAWSITNEIAAVDANGFDRYYDGLGKSYRGGIYELGSRFMGGGQRLAEARRYFRKVTERHPDWGPAWNNLGLACRDLGTAAERTGERAAKTLYEESFAAYEQAAKLSPDDPRIQNDCGLMLVYHLHRDYDFAIAQFEKAIELGTAQLDELPDKSDDEDEQTRDQRRFLEEAVGDAWQNWALLHEKRGEKKQALEKYRKAVVLYPYGRRTAAQRIEVLERELRGKRQAAVLVPCSKTHLAFRGPCPPLAALRSLDRPPDLPASARLARDEHDAAKPRGDFRYTATVQLAVALCALPAGDVAEALAKLETGDPEGALELVEPLLSERKEDPEVWYVAGRGSLEFAKQRMLRSGDGVNENLIDADARLGKADELTRALKHGSKNLGIRIHLEPALCRIEALVLRGEADAATKLGVAHARHLDSLGLSFTPAQILRLSIATADAATRKAIAAVQAQAEDGRRQLDDARRLVTQAAGRLEDLAKDGPLDVAALAKDAGGPIDALRLFQSWGNLEEWAERPVAAIRAYGRGAKLVRPAERGAFLGAMLATVGRGGGADKALDEIEALLAKTPRDATLLWYRGYARILEGDEKRLASKPAGAVASYTRARADLAESIRRNAEFENTASWWAAVALASEGWCLHVDGKPDKAKELWLAAARKHAGAVAHKDALGKSAKDGILTLGGAHFQAGRYTDGAELMREFLKALGRDDLDALNNIGFFLREHAIRLPEDTTERKKALRESWSAYERAVAVDPENVRLLNDAALIDIYYLHENSREAEELLKRAIEIGDEKLASEPPEDEAARRDLEEAVGDAHMNLGYMLIEVPERWDEAERELKKSLDYWPKENRQTRRHLRRLARARRDAKRKNGETGKG